MLVYRDLTRNAWHKALAPGKPLRGANGKPASFNAVCLADVTFRLSEKTRQRCLRQVFDPNDRHGWEIHAYAVGTETDAIPDSACIPITYDKFNTGRFIRKDTGAAISHCDFVLFAADGHTYAVGNIS